MDQYIYQILKNQLAIMVFMEGTAVTDYQKSLVGDRRNETVELMRKIEMGAFRATNPMD